MRVGDDEVKVRKGQELTTNLASHDATHLSLRANSRNLLLEIRLHRNVFSMPGSTTQHCLSEEKKLRYLGDEIFSPFLY